MIACFENMSPHLFKSAAITFVLIALCRVASAGFLIDNLGNQGLAFDFGEFNDGSARYWGQFFQAPADGNAQYLRFVLHRSRSAPVNFRVLVTATDLIGTLPIGPGSATDEQGVARFRPTTILYESDILTYRPPADALFEIDLGGLPLREATTYAFILDAFSTRDGTPHGAGIQLNPGYVGGYPFIIDASSGTRAEHFLAFDGDSSHNDLAFQLEIASVPLPSSLLLFLGLAGFLRLRVKRLRTSAG